MTTKSRPRARVTPWPCVILAVDTATRSGWSLWRHGRLVDSGEVDVLDDGAARGVVSRARGAAASGDPVVLVLERPWSQKNFGPAKAIWGRAWDDLAPVKSHRLQVYPQTWRGALFGKVKKGMARDYEWARAVMLTNNQQMGHDEAAAICIGSWACYAGQLGEVLPRRYHEVLA
jgi:hypothetical protein